MNGLLDDVDVMTSALKILVSDVLESDVEVVGNDYLRVVDVFENYFSIYWFLANNFNIDGYLIQRIWANR